MEGVSRHAPAEKMGSRFLLVVSHKFHFKGKKTVDMQQSATHVFDFVALKEWLFGK